MLGLEGYDLRGLPLLERKELLRDVLPTVGPIRYSDHIPVQGEGDVRSGAGDGPRGDRRQEGRLLRELFPLTAAEMEFSVPPEQLLRYGSMPLSVTAEDDEAREEYLRAYGRRMSLKR